MPNGPHLVSYWRNVRLVHSEQELAKASAYNDDTDTLTFHGQEFPVTGHQLAGIIRGEEAGYFPPDHPMWETETLDDIYDDLLTQHRERYSDFDDHAFGGWKHANLDVETCSHCREQPAYEDRFLCADCLTILEHRPVFRRVARDGQVRPIQPGQWPVTVGTTGEPR